MAFRSCQHAKPVENVYRILSGCQIKVPFNSRNDRRDKIDITPGCFLSDELAIKACAAAMAAVHIKVDLKNALVKHGCIDKNDYGNILFFVEQAAQSAIYLLHGQNSGKIYNELKKALFPIDKWWRDAVYQSQCQQAVPAVENSFKRQTKGLIP